MTYEVIFLLLFAASVLGCLLSGYPVAFGLAGTGLVIIGGLSLLSLVGFQPTDSQGWPILEPKIWRLFNPASDEVYSLFSLSGQTLLAIPFFVLMGVALQHSKLAERLFLSLSSLTRGLRGGLGLSVVLVGAVLAASTGVVGASVVTLGALALPSLLAQGYGAVRASGLIASAGTLGQVIPPSIILVLLAEQVRIHFQSAQTAAGNFAPAVVSSGDLFAGAMVPGVLVALLFGLAAIVLGPSVNEKRNSPGFALMTLARDVLPPLLLIVAVLGSILFGLADVTSAAAIGAVGALMLASGALRLLLLAGALVLVSYVLSFLEMNSLWFESLLFLSLLVLLALFGLRLFKAGLLQTCLFETLRMSALIFAIVIGAAIFSLSFKALGGVETVSLALSNALPETTSDPASNARNLLFWLLVLIFVAGFVLEFIEIIVVVLPLTLPLIFGMDPETLNPVWVAVLIALTLQTSFLTPPFGFALFYLRGVAPSSLPTLSIYLGALPFIALQVLALALVWRHPPLATCLPQAFSGDLGLNETLACFFGR